MTNRYQLFNYLAFTQLEIVNAWLALQGKRRTAKRSAVARFKEMPSQSLDCARMTTINQLESN